MSPRSKNENPTSNTDRPQSTLNWLRGPKLNGISAFDMIATVIGAFILSNTVHFLNQFGTYTLTLIIFIMLILFAIGLHYVMGVPTMLNHYIGINTIDEVMDGRKQRDAL
jgi:hypothetical protein